MKTFLHHLKLITPALLVIFILGSKPAKVKGQEPEKKEKKTYTIKLISGKDGKKVVIDTTFTWVDDGDAYVYCFSESDGKGIAEAKALSKTICTGKDGVWTLTSDEDEDMKLVVKKQKEGKSEADIYIIKSAPKKK